MSRHEGVSCDVCGKSNFRGKRFKCLICYDYDLCSSCYDNNSASGSSGSHSIDHPVQCILTRADHEVYFGGDTISYERAQCFTCPLCGQMGFTERRLQEHVVTEHDNASKEVVCPLCATLPGWDPNTTTDSLVAHLAMDHRSRQQQTDNAHEGEGMSYPSHIRRMLQARAASGTSSATPASSLGRSPFSYASLSRSQPQAFGGSESIRNAGSGGASSAAWGASPQYSPPPMALDSAVPVSLLQPSLGSGGGGTGSGGSSTQAAQDNISQDLVDFITQMSHGEQPTSVSSGGQYVLLSGNGTEGAPTSASEQRRLERLERSNAKRFYSMAGGGGGSSGGMSQGRGVPSSQQSASSGLQSQWECLMGANAPTGEFILDSALEDVSARPAAPDNEADRELRQQRASFSQELVLSMLDVTLDSSLLEHLEQLSSESEQES
ncbi:E3 ubiquitin-protein ligase KCMF1-like isoform X2 [Sycon ciliatum]|uniref:E3 ubiquitin-protein ligase KCMF1-like isoform X2 n=1 Tax=Sycon ciliatum TaxID=27933 RepID=UPI0031F67A42